MTQVHAAENNDTSSSVIGSLRCVHSNSNPVWSGQKSSPSDQSKPPSSKMSSENVRNLFSRTLAAYADCGFRGPNGFVRGWGIEVYRTYRTSPSSLSCGIFSVLAACCCCAAPATPPFGRAMPSPGRGGNPFSLAKRVGNVRKGAGTMVVWGRARRAPSVTPHPAHHHQQSVSPFTGVPVDVTTSTSCTKRLLNRIVKFIRGVTHQKLEKNEGSMLLCFLQLLSFCNL